jgi:hypothetical protein
MKSTRVSISICALLFGLSGPIAGNAAQVTPVREASFIGTSQWMAFGSGGWATVDGSRVRFYAADSSQRATVDLHGKEVLVSAPGATVVGVVVYADEQPSLLQAKQFNLYDEQGRKQLSVDGPDFANAVVSPTGNAFVGLKGTEDFPQVILQFYGERGQLVRSQTVKSFEGGSFCADGSHFLFETAAEGLQVAAADGQITNTIGPVETWGCSVDGRLVGAATSGQLRFFRDGKEIGSVAWPQTKERIRAIAISPDGLFAAAVSANHAAALRLDSVAYLWTKEPDSSEWNFRSIDLTAGLAEVAIGLDFDPGAQNPIRHQRSRCWLLDRNGTVGFTFAGTPGTWGARFPQVRFIDSGRRLLFADRDSARWFSIAGR